MVNIPALLEKNLRHTIEGDHGVPVSLVNPGGTVIDKTVDGRPLKGFVRRSYRETREHGEKVTVNSPVVKLRVTSLPEIPATGAKWKIGIPESPINGSGIEWFDLDPKLDVEVNKSMGTVKLYLAKMKGGTA